MDSIPSLLGLARAQSRAACRGEEPSGSPAGATRVPAAAGQRRGGQHHPPGLFISAKPEKPFGLTLPPNQTGRASCAMLALTDGALPRRWRRKKAGPAGPKAYGPAWETLSNKAARVKKRRAEKRSPPQKQGRGRAGKQTGESNEATKGNG